MIRPSRSFAAVSEERKRAVVCACHGCPAAGAPPLGPLPPGVALVHVACSRAFQPTRILAQLLAGAERVVIVGCAEGVNPTAPSDYEVEERLHLLSCLLRKSGLGPGRVVTEWIRPDQWRRVGGVAERLRTLTEG